MTNLLLHLAHLSRYVIINTLTFSSFLLQAILISLSIIANDMMYQKVFSSIECGIFDITIIINGIMETEECSEFSFLQGTYILQLYIVL